MLFYVAALSWNNAVLHRKTFKCDSVKLLLFRTIWARLEPVVWFILLVFVVVFANLKTSVLKVDASIFKATYFNFVMAYEMSLEQSKGGSELKSIFTEGYLLM